MTRSSWKGYFLDSCFIRKSGLKNLKIWSRGSAIPASLINTWVSVYNGKEFKAVYITREKIGFKFGDFAFTRSSMYKQKSSKAKIRKKK